LQAERIVQNGFRHGRRPALMIGGSQKAMALEANF